MKARINPEDGSPEIVDEDDKVLAHGTYHLPARLTAGPNHQYVVFSEYFRSLFEPGTLLILGVAPTGAIQQGLVAAAASEFIETFKVWLKEHERTEHEGAECMTERGHLLAFFAHRMGWDEECFAQMRASLHQFAHRHHAHKHDH